MKSIDTSTSTAQPRGRGLRALALSALLFSPIAITGCGDGDNSFNSANKNSASVVASNPELATVAKKRAPVVVASVAKAPEELAKLIPESAMAMVYFPNMDSALTKVRDLVAKVEPRAVKDMTLDSILREMRIPAEHADMSRPMAIAVSITAEGEPAPTFIIPCKDAQAVATAMGKDAPTLIEGSYLAMSPAGPPKLAASMNPLTDDIPAADVTLRVNFLAVMDTFGDKIREGMGEMSEMASRETGNMAPQMQDVLDSVTGFAQDFLDGAKRIDVTASMEAGEVQVGLHLLAKKGSALDVDRSRQSANLLSMASHLPAGAAIQGILDFDGASFAKFFQPLMDVVVETMPEDQREASRKHFEESMAGMLNIGPGHVFSMGMPSSGMNFTFVSDAKDADGYIKHVHEMMKSDYMTKSSGITAAPVNTTAVEGIALHEFKFQFDLSKMNGALPANDLAAKDMQEMSKKMMNRMFGGDELTMYAAAMEDKVIFHMGSNASEITRIIKNLSKGTAGKMPPRMSQAIRRAGGTPSFLIDMDLRKLVRQIISMATDMMPPDARQRDAMPSIPAGGPVRVLMFWASDGPNHRGALHVDLASVLDVVKTVQQDMERRDR